MGVWPPDLLIRTGSFKEPGKLEARKIGWIGSVRVEAVAAGSSRASAAWSAALSKHSCVLVIAGWWVVLRQLGRESVV